MVPIVELPLPKEPSFLLIADRVQTPGNLGTMLRTAVAAGVDGIVLTKGCVDLWNPKVVRGGMGAHLRVPIVTDLGWDAIGQVVKGMGVWVASADTQTIYTDVNWRERSALIVGNEATDHLKKHLRWRTGCKYRWLTVRNHSMQRWQRGFCSMKWLGSEVSP